MQPVSFKLPDLGEGVVEAEIIAWHVRPGEEVRIDQPLVDVMTDKATVTIPSGHIGRVVRTHGNVGETVAVGAELVSFDLATGEKEQNGAQGVGCQVSGVREDSRSQGEGFAIRIPAPESQNEKPNSRRLPDTRDSSSDTRHPTPETYSPQASPAVRRRARELHVDLQGVHGSGPNGRITHSDVDQFLRDGAGGWGLGTGVPAHFSTSHSPTSTAHSRAARGSHVTEIQMVGLRRRIAEKMVVSNTQIPHFSYIEEVDITELESLREHLNASRTDGQPKLTYLPFIMLSVARSLGRFPQLNAHYDVKREVITRYEAVHLGIATQTERGLCVPVVRHAEAMDLWEAAREMRRITETARNHSISRDELSGSTFTVTSLGRMGGLAATPIINHPEVGILGINKASDRPVVHQGQIAIRRILHVSGSFDHRVVDGADGATFIQCVKDYLEHPATIFI